MTTEGVAAADDAVIYLNKHAPAPPLQPSDGLAQTTTRLVVDLGPKGGLGHVGSDGSTMRQRMQAVGIWAAAMAETISLAQPTAQGVVRQLVIDDSVPTRGHRTALFDPGLSIAGVACGPHATYHEMCVVDFAGGLMNAPGAERGDNPPSAKPDPVYLHRIIPADPKHPLPWPPLEPGDTSVWAPDSAKTEARP